MFKGFQPINELISSSTVHHEESIFNTLNSRRTPIPNIHMENITKVGWECDGFGGDTAFINGGYFAKVQDGLTFNEGEVKIVLEA